METGGQVPKTRPKVVRRPWHPRPPSKFPTDPDVLREVACVGWETAAPMRGVCVAWRAALLDVRRPRLEEVLLPPHELALKCMRDRRWVDVSHDACVRVFQNSYVPRNEVEYERIGLQFFFPFCTKTLLRSILAVSTERFEALGLAPHIKRREYSLFDSLRVLRRVLERCGGLWHLAARRQAALGRRTRLRCPLELDAEHAAAVRRMAELLRTDPALAIISSDTRSRVMSEVRKVR